MGIQDSLTLITVAAGLAIYIATTSFIQWKRLRHIPGPPLAAWTNVWLSRQAITGRICTIFEETCAKYGPLVRVGPNSLVCADPAEIRRMWSIRSGWHRGPQYKLARPNMGEFSVGNAIDNKTHRRLRARVSPAYATASTESHEHVVSAYIEKLIGLIERRYISTRDEFRPCDLANISQYFTQDVITMLGFGEAVGNLDADKDVFGMMKIGQLLIPPMHVVAYFPLVRNLLSLNLSPKPSNRNAMGRFINYINGRVAQRFVPDPVTNAKIRIDDALQTIVDTGMTRAEAEAEASIFLFGGTDTTSTALRNAIFYLAAANPVAYRALQAEIDEAAKTAARPVISDEQARNLPFLQACIKEALRLWPPAMGDMFKVSDRDDVVCGIKVPAGTEVGWAALAVMKDRRVFGENAELFEPRRWIDAERDGDEERLREMEATYGLVFAAGTRWECLGKKLSLVELGKVLFELFYRFDFAMVNPIEPFRWTNHAMTNHFGMNVKISRRDTVGRY